MLLGDVAANDLRRIDRWLSTNCRAHEFVVVSSSSRQLADHSSLGSLDGPTGFVQVYANASTDQRLLAGVAQAIGDRVFCWRAEPRELEPEFLSAAFDDGAQLAEIVDVGVGRFDRTSRLLLATANRLRRGREPIRASVGTVLSRRCIGIVLDRSPLETTLDCILADIPLPRCQRLPDRVLDLRRQGGSRSGTRYRYVSRGTNLGRIFPILLGAAFGAISVLVVLYAVTVFAVSRETPQGWTTLMVAIGLGNAGVLASLGMIWSRLARISDSLTGSHHAVVVVEVDPGRVFRGGTESPESDASAAGLP